MLDKILMFIKERLVALNTAINGVSTRVGNNTNSINGLQNTTTTIKNTVDNLDSDSLWGKLTLSTNWNGPNDYCAYRQIGKLVEVRFNVTPKQNFSASSQDMMLAYGLPVDCQPTIWGVRGIAFHSGKAYRVEVPLKTNDRAGKIYIARDANSITSGNQLTGQIIFIRGGTA